MILRCRQPQKKDRFRLCGGFVGAVPNEARVLGVIRHSSVATEGHYVMACGGCGALWEVQPPERMESAA